METRVKERLTGALILVALFVIVVPEMLSGPSWRRADGNAPAADGPPVRSYTMELGGAQADQSALAPSTAARAGAEPAAPDSQPATPAPAEPAAAAPASAPEPLAAAVESPRVPPAAAPPVAATPPAAPAPAAAPASSPRSPAAPAASGTSWWVQAGSFSQSANAQRVVRELGAAGISARVSSVRSNGKELFRVRAGPVADRSAAEALQRRMAAAGHKGTLVPP